MKAEEFAELTMELRRLRDTWYQVNRQIPHGYPAGPNAPIITMAITMEGGKHSCLVEINDLSGMLRRQVERLETRLKRAVANQEIEL